MPNQCETANVRRSDPRPTSPDPRTAAGDRDSSRRPRSSQQVLAQLLVVVLHFGSCLCTLGPQRSKWKYPLGLVLTTLACIYCLFVRVIVRGTFAHLVMGMMGIEAAFRIVKVPLIVARSKAEVFLLVAMFIPNLMGTLESTIVAVEQNPIWLQI